MRIERDICGDYVLDPDELATKLYLSADELRRRMKLGLVTSLVEAGHGDDAGLHRLTARCGGAVWRAIVDARGCVVQEETGEQAVGWKRERQSALAPQKPRQPGS
ncbi:DUF6522 family protein [Microvirga pakistanensis]|uniref:DUF6522 family protein n=1 Tax=Microvirga pakistanensis TaxID=1682650 RepID=UPI001873E61D|nr:DUF6522 family protein [Microvirga pakistanensis]